MRHRIAAGALVVQNDRLLMVQHRKLGSYDFWVAPGDGVVGAEELLKAAERETAEETGLIVNAGRLAYIEELTADESRQCKFWFLASVVGGSLSARSAAARAEHIVEARFLEPGQLREIVAFPPVVTGEFWAHLQQGFTEPRYLGVREVVTNEFAV